MRILCLSTIAILVLLSSCTNEDRNDILDSQLEELLIQQSNGQGLDYFVLPESDDYANIPQDPLNPITKAKVDLGKLLYHETGIAVHAKRAENNGTYSCASCHFAAAGFQAGRLQAIGDGGVGCGEKGEARQLAPLYSEDLVDVQPLRSPSSMNGAYQKNMLWNGQFGATGLNTGTENQWTAGTPKETNHLGFEGLETQAIAGLGVHRMEIDEALINNLDYKSMFDAAFPDVDLSERYTKITAGMAIAAYERTLLSNKAPFQKWLNGDKNAMTISEKDGAVLFFGKAACAECHTGPALNSMDFYAYGFGDLIDNPEKTFQTTANLNAFRGRGDFTGNSDDYYKFKVPQLYNIKDSPFLGHGSTIRSVRQLVEYKNDGIAENPNVPVSQLADEFVPLSLSRVEMDNLTAFIEHALYDNDLLRYQPASVNSGNCIPMNDPMSRNQLGCD